MPRASSTPSHRIPLPATGFTVDQWRLVSKLPAEVMIATVALRDNRHDDRLPRQRRTVTEGLAGLDAIAAGRSSDSDLVRAVVAAIYAEPEDDRPQPADRDGPRAELTQVLADCRTVVEILRRTADPADAAVYRHWVQQVAVRVCVASGSAGEPGRRALLDDLGAALFG
jgi:hypothetical protein